LWITFVSFGNLDDFLCNKHRSRMVAVSPSVSQLICFRAGFVKPSTTWDQISTLGFSQQVPWHSQTPA
jgi:hypothetical protein